jgi:DNA-binding winged helix-turn-helix (wHTH) protein/tetratricopeptide (TPR) repeat protein
VIHSFGDFEFDDHRLELYRAGRIVKAEALTKRVLAALLRRPGALVTKDELVEEVWDGRAVADNVVTVAMARLRKLLHEGHNGDPGFIATVYGRGYRFVGAVESREGSRPPSLSEPPRLAGPTFVGREDVLERLQHALSEAAQGRGRVCALLGEPGIGKTRAVEAFCQRIGPFQANVAWGYCRESGDTPPLWPWLRLLRELAPTATLSADGPTRVDCAALEELLEKLEPSRAHSTLHVVEGAARHHTFDLVTRAIGRCANVSPWVLVLDDLHRADSASLELLSQVVDEIGQMRVLVVATLRNVRGRPGHPLESHLPYVLSHRNCERITLERLSEQAVQAYVTAWLGPQAADLGKVVFERSEGNPFFMTEMARALHESGSLEAGSIRISKVALDLIRERFVQLSPAAREILDVAAVLGRRFELSWLQAVSNRAPAELMASLDEAIAADLIVADPESNTAFAFAHDLLRAGLYDALSPADRRRLHLTIAEQLERKAEEGSPIPPSDIAYHMVAALPAGDLRKTVHYCRLSAQAAAHVYAYADVVRYLRHALEALDLMERPSVRLRMSLWYRLCLYGRGQPAPDFIRWIGEGLRLATAHDNAPMLVRAALILNAYPGLMPLPGGHAALERALSLLPDTEVGLRALALSSLSCSVPNAFDRERSTALLDAAEPLTHASGSRAVRYTWLVCKMYLQAGEAQEKAAEELTRLHGPTLDSRMAVAPLYVALYRAVSLAQTGDLEASQAYVERGRKRAHELRHTLLWHFERFAAVAQINAGQWSQGVPALTALHRRAEQQLMLGTDLFCAFDRVVILGELRGAAVTVDDATRRALELSGVEPPSMWSMKVRALASADLRHEALTALQLVPPSRLEALPEDAAYLGTLGHLTRAALRLGALDYAEALYRLLARRPDVFSAQFSFLSEGAVPQLLGMLAAALGKRRTALDYFERAIAMNEGAGLALRAAEARAQRRALRD